MMLGYCTNVHAGATLALSRVNLQRHALEVKRIYSPHGAMGLGLWFSAQAADELNQPAALTSLRQFLDEQALAVFTLNGFPYGDFHQRQVKHLVYEPTWADAERLDYTRKLADILVQLLPESTQGSISTLPIAWGMAHVDHDRAAQALLAMAQYLEALEQRTGRLIHLDLEPEPGCVLERSGDVVTWFERLLLPGGGGSNEQRVRRYLRVCHDVCHAAVMFDENAIETYRQAGIAIGKVQVSSAIEVAFDALADGQATLALGQLRAFAEPRYLHQTMVKPADGRMRFYEDLPLALDACGEEPRGIWRTHFHVPVFAATLGPLGTTQPALEQALAQLAQMSEVEHYEVETYAWNLLPPALGMNDLERGIALELEWTRKRLASEQGGRTSGRF